MTTPRRPCPPAPGPLEDYCRAFDPLWRSYAQRNGFRRYVEGLLLPRDRNKTLTALAGAEPVVGAQGAAVQRLQYFLSEARWEAERINARRLELLASDPATRPHDGGVLVIDETGDRKWGTKTAHVGRQYLGRIGKVDSGIVAVTSLWADERLYFPLEVEPYTPAAHFPKGKRDPAFRTKPEIAGELIREAEGAGVPFRAAVADSLYGENRALVGDLMERQTPFVLGLRAHESHWAPAEEARTADKAARALGWKSETDPGAWQRLIRRFRDGREEVWWAAELVFAGFGPERARRAFVATTDPAKLPERSTGYASTNLPAPESERANESPFAPADLAELVRLYGLRVWVEESYKQVKNELGWADFAVRSDRAIRRHWTLLLCAFSFCWRAYRERGSDVDEVLGGPPRPPPETAAAGPEAGRTSPPEASSSGRGENRRGASSARDRLARARGRRRSAPLAVRPPRRAELAPAMACAPALVARVVHRAPAPGATSPH